VLLNGRSAITAAAGHGFAVPSLVANGALRSCISAPNWRAGSVADLLIIPSEFRPTIGLFIVLRQSERSSADRSSCRFPCLENLGGMHWETYFRLCHEHDECESQSLPRWLLKRAAHRLTSSPVEHGANRV
jgi:hypothetical protein